MKKNLSILLLCLMPFFVWAQERHSSDPMIKVEGYATVKQVPKLMNINITISQEDIAYDMAVQKVQEKLSKMKENFKNASLDEELIKATSFRVDERFEYRDGKRKLMGYNAVMDLSVKTEYNAQTSYKAVAALTEDKEFVRFSIGFELSDDQKTALKEEALKKAVADAKAKAQILAEAAGAKLGDLNSIRYGHTDEHYRPSPRAFAKGEVMAMEAQSANMGGNLELNPKEIEISNRVMMKWEIED
ncbi:SIMPL domain-containing protein [Sediminitomix flava]|uniref:Uncharacterized protein YggE n=1 Tax=Sediminitomix flava TaxID=379075 RepID=A0A315YXI2_SEDFL|nr:SIMPL domain-containing protein [Sediminitomix flava]PWJ34187.1 uncharacterized protein YggE [Sediminitomix flava]